MYAMPQHLRRDGIALGAALDTGLGWASTEQETPGVPLAVSVWIGHPITRWMTVGVGVGLRAFGNVDGGGAMPSTTLHVDLYPSRRWNFQRLGVVLELDVAGMRGQPNDRLANLLHAFAGASWECINLRTVGMGPYAGVRYDFGGSAQWPALLGGFRWTYYPHEAPR